MKALTIRHPWCWCVVHGTKGPENRGRGFPKSYQGPVLLHAGAGWSKRGELDARVLDDLPEEAIDRGNLLVPRAATQHWEGFVFGAIIGIAEVEDIHPEMGHCCEPWGEHEYQAADGALTTEVTHLLLENRRPIPEPIPCRGGLGLWTPPRDVEVELLRQGIEVPA